MIIIITRNCKRTIMQLHENISKIGLRQVANIQIVTSQEYCHKSKEEIFKLLKVILV